MTFVAIGALRVKVVSLNDFRSTAFQRTVVYPAIMRSATYLAHRHSPLLHLPGEWSLMILY